MKMNTIRLSFIAGFLLLFGNSIYCQRNNIHRLNDSVTNNLTSASKIRFVAGKDGDLFGKKKSFIENIGQYGDSLSNALNMGKTLFGYEGLDMPVLFTSKGLI